MKKSAKIVVGVITPIYLLFLCSCASHSTDKRIELTRKEILGRVDDAQNSKHRLDLLANLNAILSALDQLENLIVRNEKPLVLASARLVDRPNGLLMIVEWVGIDCRVVGIKLSNRGRDALLLQIDSDYIVKNDASASKVCLFNAVLTWSIDSIPGLLRSSEACITVVTSDGHESNRSPILRAHREKGQP